MAFNPDIATFLCANKVRKMQQQQKKEEKKEKLTLLLIQSFHLNGQTFRFCLTDQDLEVC